MWENQLWNRQAYKNWKSEFVWYIFILIFADLTFEFVGETASLLEELLKMRLAVQDSFHWRKVAHLQQKHYHSAMILFILFWQYNHVKKIVKKKKPLRDRAKQGWRLIPQVSHCSDCIWNRSYDKKFHQLSPYQWCEQSYHKPCISLESHKMPFSLFFSFFFLEFVFSETRKEINLISQGNISYKIKIISTERPGEL